MKTYVTFGQVHVHEVNGKLFDKDSVAVIEAESPTAGRLRAADVFGDQFFTTYTDVTWDENNLKYFPRGLINVES